MDTADLFKILCAARAFAKHGDGLVDPPLPPTARAAAAAAEDALVRRLVSAHVSGEGIHFKLRGLRDFTRALDALLGRGDGRPAPITAEDFAALWALRREIVDRMASHGGGDVVAEDLDMMPDAQMARRNLQAAGAQRRAEPPQPMQARPAPSNAQQAAPSLPPAPADVRMPQRVEPIFTPPPPSATPGQRERAAVPDAPSARIEGDSIMFGDPPPQREAAPASDAAPEDAPDPRLPVAKEPAAAG